VQRAIAEVEAALGDAGRVLVRFSGTENKARVLVEGPDDAVIRAHAERIAQALRAALA
jgi:phosphoglucosamine mutase